MKHCWPARPRGPFAIERFMMDTGGRIAELYDAWGGKDKGDPWRKRLQLAEVVTKRSFTRNLPDAPSAQKRPEKGPGAPSALAGASARPACRGKLPGSSWASSSRI